jgi:hypothetical protein
MYRSIRYKEPETLTGRQAALRQIVDQEIFTLDEAQLEARLEAEVRSVADMRALLKQLIQAIALLSK